MPRLTGDSRPGTGNRRFAVRFPGVDRRHLRSAVPLAAAALAVCGCSDSHRAAPSTTGTNTGLRLVAAPHMLLGKCRATARAVGYRVPCPSYIPTGLAIDASHAPCLDIIGPGGKAACGGDKSWRGW